MTKIKFKHCLLQALDYSNTYVTDTAIDWFIEQYWNHSDMCDWDYVDFTEFAADVAVSRFFDAVENLDLIIPEN